MTNPSPFSSPLALSPVQMANNAPRDASHTQGGTEIKEAKKSDGREAPQHPAAGDWTDTVRSSHRGTPLSRKQEEILTGYDLEEP